MPNRLMPCEVPADLHAHARPPLCCIELLINHPGPMEIAHHMSAPSHPVEIAPIMRPLRLPWTTRLVQEAIHSSEPDAPPNAFPNVHEGTSARSVLLIELPDHSACVHWADWHDRRHGPSHEQVHHSLVCPWIDGLQFLAGSLRMTSLLRSLTTVARP